MEDLSIIDSEGNKATVTSLSTDDVATLNNLITIVNALSSSNNATRNVGEIFYSSLPVEDSSVHLLDGSLLTRGIYSNFVDYVASLVSKYPQLFCTETEWQTSVTSYGECGRYVYDSENNTVRLPRVTTRLGVASLASALGSLKEAGLPDVQGFLADNYMGPNSTATGAFTHNYFPLTVQSGSDISLRFEEVTFRASQYNPIYGRSSTVQPQEIQYFLYVVVANTIKLPVQVEVDNIVTDLNGKADKDFSNVTDVAKVMMAKASMPSERYVDLTLGATGSIYTAPADGYFLFIKTATASTQGIYIYVKHNGVTVLERYGVAGNSGFVRLDTSCQKGDQVYMDTDAGGGAINICRFFYAEGSKNE